MIVELENIISKNLVTSGIVSLIIAFVFLILRSKPITMFTSTPIERVVYSKERKALITIIDRSFQSLLISFCLIIFTLMFAFSNQSFIFMIIFIVAIIYLVGFAIYFISIIFKSGIKEYFERMSKRNRRLHAMMILFYFLMLFLLIPFSVGAELPIKQIQLELVFEFLKIEKIIFWMLIIMIIMLSFFYQRAFSIMIKFLDYQLNNIVETNLFIRHTVEGELSVWYLFHSTNNGQILIGDQDNIHDCKSFYFIERSELLTKKIYTTKNSENNED